MLMDLEKHSPVQSSPYDLGEGKYLEWLLLDSKIEPYSMEWRCDGNLLAFGDYRNKPKVFDVREGKMKKTYDKEFKSKINFEGTKFVAVMLLILGSVWSVKWSSDGMYLGLASDDGDASVFDFRVDKLIYRACTPDKGIE